jgi:hypothetical protein
MVPDTDAENYEHLPFVGSQRYLVMAKVESAVELAVAAPV